MSKFIVITQVSVITGFDHWMALWAFLSSTQRASFFMLGFENFKEV